jgi:hypothetical protein
MAASQISELISTMAPIAVRNATNMVLGAGTVTLTTGKAKSECDAECDIIFLSEKGATDFERNSRNLISCRGEFKMLACLTMKNICDPEPADAVNRFEAGKRR